MRCKNRVLARFPTAKLKTVAVWPNGREPFHRSVMVGDNVLDIHDKWEWQQSPAAAWRSAYEWCNRNPISCAEPVAEGEPS